MADIKFGVSQISSPTPSKVNLYVRVFTVVTTTFLGWMATAPATLIGPNSKDIINGILVLFLGLANGLAPLFGVEVTSKNIPTDSATAVDSDKTN